MCGILCEICFKECHKSLLQDDTLLQRFRNRGPNCVQTLEIKPCSDITITFHGAVLWMQGPRLTPQPVQNNKGILLYNGDIFDESWNSDFSDTQIIMDKLNNQIMNSTEEHIIQILKSLKGPFSLIYYEKQTQNLYFSRDRLGRSTMLFLKNDHSVAISSILGRNYDCIEVPATHIYCLDIQNRKIRPIPWNNNQETTVYPIETWVQNLRLQQTLPDDEFAFDFDESIDVCNHDDIVNYAESIAKTTMCKKDCMKRLIQHEKINEVVLRVTELLDKSVRIRLQRQPNKCKDCLENDINECNHCTVGVLFSGGLDCTILALLADKYLPKLQSIDLINVAFRKDEKSTYDVPDRLTGRQSYIELKTICPTRMWTFKEVNVPREELKEFQVTTIADLVYPRQTILDESLGSALWFAARGTVNNPSTSCRILLLGSGADELFGGYTRHRNSYKRSGWLGLAKELLLDWKRISYRNLSRDNRVICDHGRQPRMPYLDEDFTEFVLQLKPWFKCIPSEHLGPGVGDKLMLRLVAYKLGLTEAATLPKRALQFGSRIANSKEKGSDKSETLKKQYKIDKTIKL